MGDCDNPCVIFITCCGCISSFAMSIIVMAIMFYFTESLSIIDFMPLNIAKMDWEWNFITSVNKVDLTSKIDWQCSGLEPIKSVLHFLVSTSIVAQQAKTKNKKQIVLIILRSLRLKFHLSKKQGYVQKRTEIQIPIRLISELQFAVVLKSSAALEQTRTVSKWIFLVS